MAPACQLHMQACRRSLLLLSEVNAPCDAPAPIGEHPTRCKPWCGTFLPAALQPASTGDRRIPSEAQGHRDRTASSRNESNLASAQTLMQISKKEGAIGALRAPHVGLTRRGAKRLQPRIGIDRS